MAGSNLFAVAVFFLDMNSSSQFHGFTSTPNGQKDSGTTNENLRNYGFSSIRRLSLPLLASVVLFVGAAIGAVGEPSAKTASPALKHGETIFQSRCVVCHNKKPGNSAPFGPPNLFQVFGAQPPVLTTEHAEQIVMQGMGQMPAFNGVITKADVRDVIAYLRTEDRRNR